MLSAVLVAESSDKGANGQKVLERKLHFKYG